MIPLHYCITITTERVFSTLAFNPPENYLNFLFYSYMKVQSSARCYSHIFPTFEIPFLRRSQMKERSALIFPLVHRKD